MAVPLFDTATPLAPLESEIAAKVARSSTPSASSSGRRWRRFEREFAAYVGTEHALGVANGTDALLLALRALGVGPGDEVIVPSFTFFASAEPVALLGATPVWCDVDPSTFLIDRRARARGAHAQDQGRDRRAPVRQRRPDRGDRRARRPGDRGRRAVRRHAPRRRPPPRRARHDRHLLVLPVQEPRRLRRRRRGHDRRRRARRAGSSTTASTAPRTSAPSCYVGHNSRLDALQAGILRVQLPHLDAWADGRRAAAQAYAEAGLGELVSLPVPRLAREPAWHLYVVRSERADELLASLKDAGIGTAAYYRVPAHLQPAMRDYPPTVELPGHRGGRAHQPRDPDEPGAHAARRPTRSSPPSAR